jgi:hypothetical protein
MLGLSIVEVKNGVVTFNRGPFSRLGEFRLDKENLLIRIENLSAQGLSTEVEYVALAELNRQEKLKARKS